MADTALIVGVGPGLGASLARRFAKGGFSVALAARNADKLAPIVEQIEAAGGEARAYAADGTDEAAVIDLVAAVEDGQGPLGVAIYNASRRARGPVLELDAKDFETAWRVSCFGGFLVGREAAKRMVGRGKGTILFTGASASVKSYPSSSTFGAGKFALRAVSQSMARELGPQGIHVAHVVIDGGIGINDEDSRLRPDAIAETYWHLHSQHRSVWAQEIDVRPWVERF